MTRISQRVPDGHGSRCCVQPEYPASFLSHVSTSPLCRTGPYTDIPFRAFNLSFMIYSIIQIGEIREIGGTLNQQAGFSDIPINVLTTIIPCVIAAAELAYIGLGWKIYTEFGWQVYKFLGADRQIKKMYAQFQVFECLVKFDVFFWVAFCVQLIWLVLQKQDWEYYVTVAALPLSIIVLVEGNLAARHENKWMMYTFISGCFGALVYFVYKVGASWPSPPLRDHPANATSQLGKVITLRNGEFALTWKSLTIFCEYFLLAN